MQAFSTLVNLAFLSTFGSTQKHNHFMADAGGVQ